MKDGKVVQARRLGLTLFLLLLALCGPAAAWDKETLNVAPYIPGGWDTTGPKETHGNRLTAKGFGQLQDAAKSGVLKRAFVYTGADPSVATDWVQFTQSFASVDELEFVPFGTLKKVIGLPWDQHDGIWTPSNTNPSRQIIMCQTIVPRGTQLGTMAWHAGETPRRSSNEVNLDFDFHAIVWMFRSADGQRGTCFGPTICCNFTYYPSSYTVIVRTKTRTETVEQPRVVETPSPPEEVYVPRVVETERTRVEYRYVERPAPCPPKRWTVRRYVDLRGDCDDMTCRVDLRQAEMYRKQRKGLISTITSLMRATGELELGLNAGTNLNVSAKGGNSASSSSAASSSSSSANASNTNNIGISVNQGQAQNQGK